MRNQISGFRFIRGRVDGSERRPIDGVELCESMHRSAGLCCHISPPHRLVVRTFGRVQEAYVSLEATGHYCGHARPEGGQLIRDPVGFGGTGLREESALFHKRFFLL